MTRPAIFILALLAFAGQVRAQTQTDAISREFTVYVDMATYPPITDAVSREFTVYIGNQPLREQTDAVTREFTVFLDTAGDPNVINDAICREFTVYIGNQPLREQTDAVTREFTVFLDSDAGAPTDAISREFTVYFGNQPLREQTDAVSREFTAFVGEFLSCPSWIYLTDGPPLSRFGMAFDPLRRVGVLFGGADIETDGAAPILSGDTHEWNGSQWTLRSSSGPSPRSDVQLAYDAIGREMLLFGGQTDAGADGETWVWDGNAWQQRFPASAPSPRWGYNLAYDSLRGVTVLFGGTDGTQFFGDTWEWDGADWALRAVPGPAARSYAAAAFDENRGVVVLFGGAVGAANGEPSRDTWEFDGNAWTLRDVSPGLPDAPDDSMAAGMTYASAVGRVVLHGGYRFLDQHDTLYGAYIWSGDGWTDLQASSPVQRAFHVMVPAGVTGFLTVHGGSTSGPDGATHAETLRFDLGLFQPVFETAAQRPASQSLLSGQTAVFVATPAGTPSPSFEWRKDGQLLMDGPSEGGGTISGSDTGTLTISGVGLADAGEYVVTADNVCGSDSSTATLVVIFPPGDFDCDGMIDAADIGEFAAAMAGPGTPVTPLCSPGVDLDGDGDADLVDFTIFQILFP